MELHLRVINRLGQISERLVTLSLGDGGISIGRGLANDLCLEDPERVVSSRHARVELRDGGLWVTDTSRNGTYLNDSPDPIPEHQAVALYDGDRLGIGPYEVVLSFGVSAAPIPRLGHESHTDACGGDLSGLAHLGATTDILDLLDPETARRADPGAVGHAAPIPNLSDALFGDAASLDEGLGGPALEAPAREAPHRHTPVEQVFYRPAERQGIPEDYDLLNDAWNEGLGEVIPARVAAVAPEPRSDGPRSEDEPRLENERTDVMPAFQEAAVIVPPRRPEPPRPKPLQGSTSDDRERRAFLEGLGVGDPSQIEDPETLLRDSGALLRALASGLIQTMMTRAQFKSELRLGVTTLRAAENNPFKFSVDASELLERLLLRPRPGFLPPVVAAREAFEDIQAHEMAMTAGLRAALRALLARFEPSALAARLGDASGLDQVLPMARKAKLWDLFNAAYGQVASDAAEDFMQLFDEAFARAYREQVERLRAARGNRRD